jgi:hypothetical protein
VAATQKIGQNAATRRGADGQGLPAQSRPPEQLKGLIRAGYVYRNGEEHLLTDMGRGALAKLGVQPGDSTLADDHPPLTADCYPCPRFSLRCYAEHLAPAAERTDQRRH